MDHLRIRETVITPMRIESASRRIADARQHVVSTFKAGTVCAKCNNGWMSQLEGEAKPILISLIADPRGLGSLSERHRLVVARWALKTAAVLNRSSTYGTAGDGIGRPVPDEHLTDVMECRVPGDVVILGGGYLSTKPFEWLQFATWAAPSNSIPLLESDRNGSYKIGLAFCDLMLAVAYYPSPEYLYAAPQGNYVSLWEGRKGVIPVARALDDSVPLSHAPVLERFLRNVFLLSKTWVELVGNMATTRIIVP